MIHLDRKIVRPRPEYNCSAASVVLYESNIMDKVLEPIEVLSKGKFVKLINPQRDVSVLFNQDRLNGFNSESILNYFKANEGNSQLDELRKKCTDEQLISLCKSRFIQTPTELQNYFEYLELSFDSEVKRLASEIQNVQNETIDKTDETTSAE